jgi:hypothetical protein
VIENATLIRIDRLTGATAKGKQLFTAGATVAIRCNVQDVTSAQRSTLGATIKDASSVARLYADDLTAAGLVAPVAGDQLAIVIDGDDPAGQVSAIISCKRQSHDSQSHFECFVKPV